MLAGPTFDLVWSITTFAGSRTSNNHPFVAPCIKENLRSFLFIYYLVFTRYPSLKPLSSGKGLFYANDENSSLNVVKFL